MILCDEIGYNVTHQNEKHVSRLCTAQSRQYSINKISEESNEKVYKSTRKLKVLGGFHVLMDSKTSTVQLTWC